MVSNADKIGTAVTVGNDSRITKVGAKLRGCRLDELPQVLDLISGDMSFVGTRPEAVKYVEKYKPVYMATLLLPAGITSEASIRYKDEAELLEAAADPDTIGVFFPTQYGDSRPALTTAAIGDSLPDCARDF